MTPRIAAVEVFDIEFAHLRRPHHFVVVRVHADDGSSGIGEVAMIYGDGARAAVAHVQHLAAKYLIGESIEEQARIWKSVDRQSFWQCGGGPVHWGSMAALDNALWDLRARRQGVPVHALLGGSLHDALPLYANGWYGGAVSPSEFGDRAADTVAQGWQALKFDPFRMSADGRMTFPPRQVDDDFARLAVARVAAVREAIGPDVKLMLDLHGSLGLNAAIRWGREFARYDLYFLEDAIDTDDPRWMRELADKVPARIACGDRLYNRQDALPYLEARATHVLQTDVGLAGGFSEAKRLAELAEVFHVEMALHNCAGPITTACSVQLAATLPNFLIQEWFPFWTDERYDMVDTALERRFGPGPCPVPTEPGIGITLNADFLKHWPCHVVDRVAGRTTA